MQNQGETISKVICLGSMGKDIFFPILSGTVIENSGQNKDEKKFCFGYGGKVHVEDRFTAPGGCACNVSVGLTRLGIEAYASGNVGGDTDGAWIVEKLKSQNVDVGGVQIIKESDTDISVIIVDQNTGERTIFVNRDVGENFQIEESELVDIDWCFVGSLYGEDIDINMQKIHKAVSEYNLKLAYNPGGKNIKQDENIVLDLIHHSSIVFLNKEEAISIVSKFDLEYNKDIVFLLKTISSHMLNDDGIVVLTDGINGAWVFDGIKTYHTKTIDKYVKDSTGAGDAFASGFLASMLHGNSVSQGIAWGSANGDAVIDEYGAHEKLMTINSIQDRIGKFPVTEIE